MQYTQHAVKRGDRARLRCCLAETWLAATAAGWGRLLWQWCCRAARRRLEAFVSCKDVRKRDVGDRSGRLENSRVQRLSSPFELSIGRVAAGDDLRFYTVWQWRTAPDHEGIYFGVHPAPWNCLLARGIRGHTTFQRAATLEEALGKWNSRRKDPVTLFFCQ